MTLTTLEAKTSYQLSRWDLSELLPETSEEVVARRIAAIEQEVAAFEARRAHLAPGMDPALFLDSVRQYEAILQGMNELSGYASLWFYEDTGNTEALTFQNRVRQLITAAFNRILFWSLWWKDLDDAQAAALLPADPQEPKISDLRHFLLDLRRTKPYTLDERSEQVINIKDDNGISAVTTLYSMLTNRLEFTLAVDGEEKKLTRDALLAYAFSPRADLREATYRELYRAYEAEAPILGQIYVNRARDWYNEYVGLRGYRSPIAATQRRQRRARRGGRGPPLGDARQRAALPALLPAQGRLAGDGAPAPLRHLRPARHLRPRGPLRRGGAAGARHLQRIPPALRPPGRAGVRRGAHRLRAPPGQAERRLLLDRGAPSHALGAGQLRRQGARRGDPRPRARPCRPQHARRGALLPHPALPRCRSPRPPRCSARC